MEPNDDPTAGGLSRIGRGDERRGWMHPRGDVDWWRLDLAGESSSGIVPLDVSLHAASGDKLTGREGLMAPDASTFTHFLEPGSYLIRVFGARGQGASSRDAYALEVLR